jgi:hypothetical protein
MRTKKASEISYKQDKVSSSPRKNKTFKDLDYKVIVMNRNKAHNMNCKLKNHT